ncbi:MAG TPA: hypothetical protein VG826_35040 [Pirellulales bacterium]|nr:hypothetical protein [Pirellulales bacterium]
MPRPQFTLRALLVLLLAVACFFGGIRFERERQRRADEAAAELRVESWLEAMSKREPRRSYEMRVVHPGGAPLINDLPRNR